MTNPPRVLVTGGRGYVGTALSARLRDNGYHVTGLDNHRTNKVDWISGTEQFYLDIAQDSVEPFVRSADVVVHLAAMSDVEECELNPMEATRINLEGTAKIVRACGKHKVPMILASSIGVYGNVENVDVDQHRSAPNFYMRTKRAGEDMLWEVAKGRMPSAIFQVSNLFGSYDVDVTRVDKPTVINYFIDRAKEGETLTVHEPGEQTRDFLHVTDAVKYYHAAVDVMMEPQAKVAETYLIASGRTFTVLEIAELVQEHASAEVDIEMIDNPREGDVRRIGTVNTDRARNVFGVEPGLSVEETVRRAFHGA